MSIEFLTRRGPRAADVSPPRRAAGDPDDARRVRTILAMGGSARRLLALVSALIVHPRVFPVVRDLCGPQVRLDSAYARDHAEFRLHGGGHEFWGDTYYLVRDGRLHCGLTKVLVALHDANDRDGGFCCIPGSHKAAFPTPASVTIDDPLLQHVPLRAGDALVFTDALAHAGRRWTATHERRALFLSYTPGMLTWSDPVLLQQRFYDLLDDDVQRSVVRIPNVERLMAPSNGCQVPSIDDLRPASRTSTHAPPKPP